MMCERYWRDGIVLVERGLEDPHRGGCVDCARAHASRAELISALPLIGEGHSGDPHWQAGVWRRIDGARGHGPRRWQWQLAGAVACGVALWIGLSRTRPDDVRPRFGILDGEVLMRSRSPVVGNRLQVTVGETSDVWIYRGDDLMLRCRARQVSAGCAPDRRGMVVEMTLSIAGEYHAIVVTAPPGAQPRGSLDEDRAMLESAGIAYQVHDESVH